MITVSIIIPIYNREAYLRECLDSVLGQTLRNIEIICVDDGSTDPSNDVIKEYESKYSNVIAIFKEKQGVGAARNAGIKKAAGKYIAFMDSDDFYYDKHVLQLLVDKAEAYAVKICGGCSCQWNHEEGKKKYLGSDDKNMFSKEEVVQFSDYQNPYGFWRFIFDRELLTENDIYFPLYSRYQDPEFFIRAMDAAKEFVSLPYYVYCHRKNHKAVQYDKNTVMDIWRAIADIQQIAVDRSYNKIVAEMNDRIAFLERHIYQLIMSDDKEISDFLCSYNKHVCGLNRRIDENSARIKNLLSFEEVELYVKAKQTECMDWIEKVNKRKIVIYGAGQIGKDVLAFFNKNNMRTLQYFVISSDTPEPTDIEGVPVKSFKDVKNELHDMYTIIATTTPLYRKQIIEKLRENSITNYEQEVDSAKIIEWNYYISK